MGNEYQCLLTIILTLPYIKCLLPAKHYFWSSWSLRTHKIDFFNPYFYTWGTCSWERLGNSVNPTWSLNFSKLETGELRFKPTQSDERAHDWNSSPTLQERGTEGGPVSAPANVSPSSCTMPTGPGPEGQPTDILHVSRFLPASLWSNKDCLNDHGYRTENSSWTLSIRF